MFWGDMPEERARHSLRTSLWRLRRLAAGLEGQNKDFILSTTQGEAGIGPDIDLWLDVAAFEQSIPTNLTAARLDVVVEQLAVLEKAVGLYTGDFLEGIYCDWVLSERERLRDLYLKGLRVVMRAHERLGDYEAAIYWGRRILAKDPLHEMRVREVMRLFVINGQRAAALRLYETSARLLRQELDISPMPETCELYRRIVADDRVLMNPQMGNTTQTDWETITNSFEKVLEEVEHTRVHLQEIYEILEKTSVTTRWMGSKAFGGPRLADTYTEPQDEMENRF
jgi:DNA-binding SARP family transcriptional activator